MRAGVYNEGSSGLGGSEALTATIAGLLRSRFQVDIVHHSFPVTLDELADFADVGLDGVTLRPVEREPFSSGTSHLPWRRHRQAIAWHAAISRPYDLFIAVTHCPPPFCHARRGMLVVLFPWEEAPAFEAERSPHGSAVWRTARARYHWWQWHARLASYDVHTAISEFTRRWTRRRWRIDPEILYPPVDIESPPVVKADTIVSVGRFSAAGHSKKQVEMMRAFGDLADLRGRGARYVSAGLCKSVDDRRALEAVREAAAAVGGEIAVNPDRPVLKQLYAGAKVFWHAAGLDENETAYPERSEHFGIVTVEAMAAGCVPVVIDRGAQAEIVEHGVSGFVWRSRSELLAYTRRVLEDAELFERLSAAARKRARLFGREEFARRFFALLGADGTT